MYDNQLFIIAKDFLTDNLEKASKLSGGPQRQVMGQLVEQFTDLIWNYLSEKYSEISATITVGKNSPIEITDENSNIIEESVDRHCYIQGQLVWAIECKTYLDKCYMQRADSDFNLMKEGNPNFQGIIISLENGIADNSYNFFLNRNNINTVYYLADGKRKSTQHISRHIDRLNDSLLIRLITDMENLFIQATK